MFKNFQNYFWSSQRSIISIMKKNFKIFQSERFQICRHSSSKILCDVVLEALQATHLLQSSQAILHHVSFFVLSSVCSGLWSSLWANALPQGAQT